MTAPLVDMLGYLHRLRSPCEVLAQSDAALLRRFVRDHDGGAFAALVGRHGPLVLGVCRRWLRRAEDIEDAFQATFLVLARRAGHVGRPERLGNWLFGVALRVARKVRGRERRRATAALPDDLPGRLSEPAAELASVLDEELARLPERDRLVLVLCCLEGRSREEAARELGVSPGAVKGLLERGRRRLRDGLARRGVGPALPAPVVVPLALSRQAAEAGLAFAAGALASPAAYLAQGVISDMFSPRWSFLAALLLGLACGVRLALPPGRPAALPSVARAPLPKGPPVKPLDLKEKAQVGRLAFLPKSTTLVGATKGELVLWDSATGKEKDRLAGHERTIVALAVSRDGRLLATADGGGVVKVRDAAKGREMWETSLDSPAYALAFAADGKTLYGVSGWLRILRWENDVFAAKARAGVPLPSWSLGVDQRGLCALAASPDGKFLLAGGQWGLKSGESWNSFHAIDVETGKVSLTRSGAAAKQREVAAPVAVAPGGKTWAGAGADNVILLGKSDKLTGHTATITSLAFLPDGTALVSGSRDGTVRFWNVKTRKQVAAVKGQGEVIALAVSPDGKRVAWADSKGAVKVRSVAALLKTQPVKERDDGRAGPPTPPVR